MAIKQLSINNETLDISNFAKLNGSNVFSSSSRYTNRYPIILQNLNLDLDNPVTDMIQQLWFQDKLNRGIAVLQYNVIGTDGNFEILQSQYINGETIPQWDGLCVSQNLETGEIKSIINGTINLNSNDSTIATTNWVRKYLQSKGIS